MLMSAPSSKELFDKSVHVFEGIILIKYTSLSMRTGPLFQK
jgi:hypothetical protein